MSDGAYHGSSARLGVPAATPSGSSAASQSPTRQRSMSFTAYAGATAAPVGPAPGAQRVIVIGAHDSGKTTAALHVFANEATAAAVGTDIASSSTATVHDRADSSFSRGGDAARPGRCVLRKHRLRRSATAMDSSTGGGGLAAAPSSPNFNLANADNNSIAGGSMVGSVAAPKVQTFNVDVIDAVVGAPSLVPVEVLELRDTDAAVLAADRIFSRDVLTRQTAAIIVTVDCASLVCRPPALKADDMETVVRGLANAGAATAIATTSPSRSPATRPVDAAASTVSTVKPSPSPAGGPVVASKTDFLRMLEAVDEERLRGVCLAQVRAAMDAAEAAHMDMEISSAARTVAHCVDALKRYHPCPPCCRIIVAVTKSDVVEGVCCARQLVLAEAARVGETYVKQRKATLSKARGKAAVTVLESRTAALARARGEGDTGLPRTAARAVDEQAVAADAKAFLARAQRRLLEAIESLINGSGVGSTNESFTSPASSTAQRHNASSAQRASSRSAAAAASSARLGGPAPLGMKFPPFEPAVVAVSAVSNGGASLVHLWNALLAPSADTQRKLSRLLDAVKRNTRLQAATLMDLHSGLFIASDANSTARLPNAGQIALTEALADVTGPQESHEAVAEFATRAYERGHRATVALGRSGEPVRCSGCLFGSADEGHWLDADATSRAAIMQTAGSVAGGARSGRTPKKAHFADDGDDGGAAVEHPVDKVPQQTSAAPGPMCLPRGAVIPWRWRSRMQTALQMAVATRAAIPAGAASNRRTAASDVFEASVGVGDGSVLLVAGLTGEGLALAASIAAKDAGNASHVAFNIGILRRTVADMLSARRGGAGNGTGGGGGDTAGGGTVGGGATGGPPDAATNSGSGWEAPAAARPRRDGPRAVVVSPRVTPRSALPSPRTGSGAAGRR